MPVVQFCEHCGQLISADAAACPVCGGHVTEQVLFKYGAVCVTQQRIIVGQQQVRHAQHPKVSVTVSGLPPVEMPAYLAAAFLMSIVAAEGGSGTLAADPHKIGVVR